MLKIDFYPQYLDESQLSKLADKHKGRDTYFRIIHRGPLSSLQLDLLPHPVFFNLNPTSQLDILPQQT